MKTVIQTDKAPVPVGPYNQAIVVDNFIYTAGQIALDPETNQMIEGDIKQQTRMVFNNLREVLKAAGTDLNNVIKTTVFLSDMNEYPHLNEVYAEFFTEDYPARSAIQVARLPKDALVEAECVAIIP